MSSSRYVAAAGIAAALGAMALPASLGAQNARPSGSDAYSLMQISVAAASTDKAAFIAETDAIRSCREGRQLAQRLDADVRRNRFVPEWELTPALKEELDDLPTGHATRVFTNDPSVMRVLVVCNRI